jgi:hypothetical protein
MPSSAREEAAQKGPHLCCVGIVALLESSGQPICMRQALGGSILHMRSQSLKTVLCHVITCQNSFGD